MNIRRIFSALVAVSATAAVLGSLVVAGATAYAAHSEPMYLHIVGGSMEPTIHKGTVITVDPRISPAVNDIISFITDGSTVTHRVVKRWTSVDPHGVTHTMFKTKGDANRTADAWTLTDENILGTRVKTPMIIVSAEPFANHPLLIAILLLPLLAMILISESITVVHSVHDIRHVHSH